MNWYDVFADRYDQWTSDEIADIDFYTGIWT
ncbi:hypothetical protein ABIA39_008662 [Nocardia sp. GAS34]